MANVMTWTAETASSGLRGRALARIRTNNFVVDDYAVPPYNGPGEEPGAGELFLVGITTCAVLMIERLARAEDLPLAGVRASMEASRDTSQPIGGIPVLDSARLELGFRGLTREQAGQLVQMFKDR
jgi:uncharacterized OsmC-like protein